MYTVAPFVSAAAAAGMRTVADVFASAWPLLARQKDGAACSLCTVLYAFPCHDDQSPQRASRGKQQSKRTQSFRVLISATFMTPVKHLGNC